MYIRFFINKFLFIKSQKTKIEKKLLYNRDTV